jgi:hypothetical protein
MKVKIQFKIDDKVLELSDEKAKELYLKLHEYFGRQERPIYIPYIEPCYPDRWTWA